MEEPNMREAAQAGPDPTGRLSLITLKSTRYASARPKRILALWLLFVVGITVLGGAVGTRTLTGSDANVGETARAEQMLKRAGLTDPPVESLMVSSESPALTRQTVISLQEELARTRGVESVSDPYGAGGPVTDEGRKALIQATLVGDPEQAGDHAAGIEAAVGKTLAAKKTGGKGRTVVIDTIGPASVDHAVDKAVGEDLQKAELFSVPITLLVLAVAFGALVAASVPLLLGVTSVIAAMGCLALVSQLFPVGDASTSLIVLLGLAVGVDYSLFYIRREREERRQGASAEAALKATAATVGRAIVIAGMTVIIGLGGLLVTGLPLFISMALGTMLVVLIAVTGSLTVLPAVLTLLGDRIDRGRIPLLSRRMNRETVNYETTGFWGRLAGPVSRRPGLSLFIGLALLGTMAVPALHMKTGDPEYSLPANTPIMVAQKRIEAAFPGSPDAAELVVSGSDLRGTAAKSQLLRIGKLAGELTGAPGQPGVRVSGNGKTAVVEVALPATDPAGARQLIHRLRDTLKPEAARRLAGAELLVTGSAAGSVDFADRLRSTAPLVVGMVLMLALALVFWAFRSLPLAFGVVALNLVSIAATCGITTAIFQETWAEGLLDFTSNGSIVSWVPLFAFVILFGLSMDYTVFVLERIREYRRQGLSPRVATREGIARTAGAVTSAAAVMVAVFMIFPTLPLIEMKMLGIALAAGILIDATLVRGIALPAMVAGLGESGVRAESPRSGMVKATDSPAGPIRVEPGGQ